MSLTEEQKKSYGFTKMSDRDLAIVWAGRKPMLRRRKPFIVAYRTKFSRNMQHMDIQAADERDARLKFWKIMRGKEARIVSIVQAKEDDQFYDD